MKKNSMVFAAIGIFIFAGCLATTPLSVAQETVGGDDLALTFDKELKPLLVQYCAECHEPGSMKGLDFLTANSIADIRKMRGVFAGVVEQLESNAMPPRDFDQPTANQKNRVIQWLKKTLELKPSETDRISQYVVEVFQDSKGNLWFGTMSDGVVRFDGTSLTYFSTEDGLPDVTVSSIAEDQDGNIWLGTHQGVCRFDGDSFESVGITQGLPRLGPGPLASAGVNSDRKGKIWASVGKKVYRYDGDSFVEFKLPLNPRTSDSFAIVSGRVSFSLEDSKGNLWFKSDGLGAFRYDGKSFTQFTKDDGLCSNNVNNVVEDGEGNIWFACMQSFQPKMTGDGGVCRFDGTSFTTFEDVKGLANNDIYTIYKTRSGDVWIGATGHGAYRFNGKDFQLFSKTDRPHWTRNFGLQSMLEDRDGTLWFGFSGGLFRFNGQSFFNVTKKGPWQDVTSAMADLADGTKDSADWLRPGTVKALVAVANGNVNDAAKEILSLKESDPDEATVQEKQINLVGYHLLFSKRLDAAIKVFKLNTLLYPEAFNAFDSLGEAYRYRGDLGLAVKNYKKSVQLNPQNKTAVEAIKAIEAQQRYQGVLVASANWMEEVIIVPPDFAPKMSLVGLEHLRLPKEFRNPDSDWFMTYLFAIELTEEANLDERKIGQQLLLYFQGLSRGGRGKDGKPIDTSKFSIKPAPLRELEGGEFSYVLDWQEPFVAGTPLRQTLRVKLIRGKNQHGVLFICCSPQRQDAEVWKTLLEIRRGFEEAKIPRR